MSVQLILYPQNHKGVYQTTSVPVLAEYVADSFFFFLSTYTTYVIPASTLFNELQAVTAVPPIQAWLTWRTSTTTAPLGNANGLVFSAGSSGVYQKVENLNVGVLYDLKIKIVISGTGNITIGSPMLLSPNLTVLGGDVASGGLYATLSTTTVTTHTLSFTATESSEIFIMQHVGAGGCTIESVSITDSVNPPSQGYGDIFDGQVICDMYEEEDIPLSLSIDNFTKVAEKSQSYSKDFNLPATKRNNQIFNHLFDVTRVQDGINFNPYLKTKCILKQDGYTLFQGYLRLIDISDKEQEVSYNVSLFSESVALKDILENKKFKDLNFRELTHIYNKTNIKASWFDSTGIALTYPLQITSNAYDASLGINNTNVLKYPFVNWVGDYNLNNTTGNIILDTFEDAFRPFIQCKYLLDEIFDATPFTYTSQFLNSTDFTDLFMDFNWGSGNAPNDTEHIGETNKLGDQLLSSSFATITMIDSNFPAEFGYSTTTSIFTCPQNNTTYQLDYSQKFDWVTAVNNLTVQWRHTTLAGIVTDYNILNSLGNSVVWSVTYQGTVNVTLNSGDTLAMVAMASSPNTIQARYGGNINGSVTITSMTNSVLLNTIRGDLGQWEFIKGFINMFNLVVLQDKDNPNNLLIETYDTVFFKDAIGSSLASRNITHDWTDKIDVTEIKLIALELSNSTLFKYSEDDGDYNLKYYKSVIDEDYGSEEHFATNSNLSIFSGEAEVSASPFSATFIRPLLDYLPNFIIPVIFSSDDEQTEFSSFDNKPRILYKVSASPYEFTNGRTYYIPQQNGTASENADSYLRFSHTTSIPSVTSDRDLNYGAQQLLTGATPLLSLYEKYWSSYYGQLYNPNTKYMKIKVNLTAADINSFSFDEYVMVKNKSYRVNKIEYKPNELSTVEFILLP
tara:strand:- start:986 stop:3700 length:2715 start_codon:yes stop_codon:yes gene_type:complete